MQFLSLIIQVCFILKMALKRKKIHTYVFLYFCHFCSNCYLFLYMSNNWVKNIFKHRINKTMNKVKSLWGDLPNRMGSDIRSCRAKKSTCRNLELYWRKQKEDWDYISKNDLLNFWSFCFIHVIWIPLSEKKYVLQNKLTLHPMCNMCNSWTQE